VSILELLFAIVLLALALAGAYALVMQCTRMMLAARDHYVATSLCLARVELARNVDYSLISLLGEAAPGLQMDQDGAPDGEGHFRRQSIVKVDSPDAATTKMDVTVYIRNRRSGIFGQDKETMSCIFTKYLTPEDI